MLHAQLCSAIVGFTVPRTLVGRNPSYDSEDDQLAIRSGRLDEKDPWPGLVVAVPSITFDGDLSGRAAWGNATVEVRALALSLLEAWRLALAVAFDGGTPNDPARTSGLDGFKDSSKGIRSCRLTGSTEAEIPGDRADDRPLYVVELTFAVEFVPRLI